MSLSLSDGNSSPIRRNSWHNTDIERGTFPYWYHNTFVPALRESLKCFSDVDYVSLLQFSSFSFQTRDAEQKFVITLDVGSFLPSEMNVDLAGRVLTITGEHAERDEGSNGTISRFFSRRYKIPNECDLGKICSSIDPKGKLLVEVPKTPTDIQSRNITVAVKK